MHCYTPNAGDLPRHGTFFLNKNHHDGIFANMLVKGEPNISYIAQGIAGHQSSYLVQRNILLLLICGQQAELLLS
jgi:hypothetical protein